jgi:hypothetical protein
MKKIALTPRSKELIKNYLVGGAALGGSGALLTSLVNYLNTLKSQTKKDTDEEDDNTLFLNVNAKKAEDVNKSHAADFAAGGMAMTGGLLSTLGTYALVRKLYQNIKKKQLQEQLDKAQQEFIQSAEAEGEAKRAAQAGPGTAMGLGEIGVSLPVAFALLSALAAGSITNMSLNKYFPRLKKKTDLAPKRIVIRKTPEEQEQQPELEEEKNAYDKIAQEEQESDALDFLINICMGSKAASQSELVDIVHAVAQGRGADFTQHLLEYGFDSALDTIKGAGEVPITAERKQYAISYCTKSAALSPGVALLAAAEYNDMAPRFTKISSLQNEEAQHTLFKIAGLFGAVNRRDVLINTDIDFSENEKSAAMSIADVLEAINALKAGEGAQGLEGEEDMEQNENIITEDSIDSGEEKEVNDRKPLSSNKIAPDVINELGDEDDLIDEAMSQPITAAKAVASESK